MRKKTLPALLALGIFVVLFLSIIPSGRAETQYVNCGEQLHYWTYVTCDCNSYTADCGARYARNPTGGCEAGGLVITPSADGHKVSFSCNWASGGQDNAFWWYCCDKLFIYPVISLTSTPSTISTVWQNTDASANVSCTHAGTSGCNPSSYRLLIYSSDPGACPQTYADYTLAPPRAISSHSWVCGTGKDNAGELGFSGSLPMEFLVDKITPTGTISINSGAAFTTSSTATLTLTYSDTGDSGIKDCSYSNDGTTYSAWEACSGIKAWTLSVGEGYKTVYYKIRDNAGNSFVASDMTEFDLPPTVTVTGAPAAWVNTDQTATITCTDTRTGCDSQSYMFKTYTDASSVPASCPVDYTQYQASSSSTMAISSQTWVCAAAKDTAGNWNYSAVPLNFLVEKGVPAAAITNESSTWTPAAWVNQNNISFSCTESGPSGCVSSISYGFVPSAGNCTDTTALTLSTTSRFMIIGNSSAGAAAGDHGDFLCIRVSDNAGNKATAASDALMVDVTQPVTTDDVDTTKWYGSTVQLRFNCSDSTSGCKKIIYCISDEAASCMPNKEIAAAGEKLFQSPVIAEAVSCGTQPRCNKRVVYQSEDFAGNREALKTKSPIQIDTAIPTCVMKSPTKAYTTIPDIPVSWEASGQGGSSITRVDLQMSVDSENDADFRVWSAETSLTGTKTYAGSSGHRYYFRCSATNQKGTGSGWSTAAFTMVDMQAPPVQLSADSTLVNTTSFGISWTTDEPESVVNYTIYYKEGTAAYKLWKFFTAGTSAVFGQSGSPVLANNMEYTLKVSVTDTAGNTAESNEVKVKVDTGKPTCTVASLVAYQPSDTFTVSWSATDAESGIQAGKYVLWVKILNDPWIALYNQGTSRDITATGDGVYRFKCAAMDTAGNMGDSSAEKNTTVDTGAPQTSVLIFNSSVDQGQNQTITATFTDPIKVSSATLSYGGETVQPTRSVTNLDQSVWELTWSISDLVTTGQRSFTITVTDAKGNQNTTDYTFMVKLCDEGTTRRCGACGSGQMRCTDGEWTDCTGEDPTLMKPETCNGQDDDCTTIIDDINSSITPEITHCACTYQPAASIPDILLRAEACNGIDDNCDGSIDDNAGCCIPEGKTQECGADIGICKNRVKTCTGQKWGPCEWELGPEPAEICGNTLDDNCDGSIDEDCETCTDDDRDGYGYPGSNLCSYPEQDCDDADINVNPGVSEVCNSLDDDCNGQADEYLDCGHCTNNAQDADEEGADCGGAECPACFVWGWLWLTVGGIVILIILAVVWMHMKKQGRELTWETLKEKWSQPE